MRLTATTLTLVAVVAACSEGKPRSPKVLVGDEPRSDAVVIGVLPEQFRCESVAPPSELEIILGTYQPIAGRFEPPEGLAKPCNYFVPGDGGGVQFSFDIDCRAKALDDGNRLLVQYAKSDQAQAVRVGKSGVDYRGVALVFLDDDSPCYARVLGPSAPERLAIARLVAGNLDETTAPTSLRYRKGGDSVEP
jgi:hypothetical protein